MDFATLAAQRYSLRKYSDRPVEQEKLDAILETGRNAPTAHNNQPQRIFVIRIPEGLERVDSCIQSHFRPPVVLVVTYDASQSWKREKDGADFGEVDAAIVATQMMLQAADLGLGTTYVALFDPEKLREAFPAMAGLEIVGVLTLGYPAEGARPSRLHEDRKPLEELVQYL